MRRQRDRGDQRRRAAGPAPGFYPIDSGTAELVQDRDNANGYLLMVNGVESSHIDLSDPGWLEFEYMRWIAAAIQHSTPGSDPLRVVHLGAAACSLARYLLHVRPSSRHLAVDSDGTLARLVREWFDLPKAPALRIRVGDARAVTASLPDAGYTVVVRDVFLGAVTPPSMTSVEFTADVRRVLEPRGLYLLNCAATPDLALAKAEAATVGAVFPFVAIIADPPMLKGRRRGNVIIIGSHAPVGDVGLRRELLGGAVPAQLWGDRRVRDFGKNHRPVLDADIPGRGDAGQRPGPAPITR